MDKLDQIHVVSDLHLGGAPGQQIMNQGEALAQVIDHLAGIGGARVGLVLNGDIVDFLAAEDARHFDAEGAPRKLRAIFDDPAFSPVWSALLRFARTPDRLLVLVLGNHDVELALPAVQDLLLARLTGGDAAARGRVRLAMDGAGYTCLVGGRRVLCVHGNDADPWNVVDHDALRAFIRAENVGGRATPPSPNAGTRLVVDVMNDIKRQYPFVDLLKPETVPVPGVLLALPASVHAKLLDFARILLRLGMDKARSEAGFLSAEEPPPAPADGYRALAALIGATAPSVDPGDLLAQAERDHAARRRPTDAEVLGDEQMLGVGGLILDRVRGRDGRENLREALQSYLAGDRTFAHDTEDAIFHEHDEEVSPEVSFLVAGHTHLERRLLRKRGGGVYFNSGTWIRLIRMEDDVLASPRRFEPVYRALAAGRLADLDATPGLVITRRTVVSIWTEAGEVHGELRHAHASGAAGPEPWDHLPETRFSLASLEN